MERMFTHRATRMDSFIGILTLAAVLLLFLTFVALSLIFLRYNFNTTIAETAAPRGVGPELLLSLPVTVYRAEDHVGVECAVCLAGLEDGEEARLLPRCGHGFHAGCVDRWLASRSTGPLCRVTVVGKPDVLTSTSLPSVPPEPANYVGSLPASVLLGVSDHPTLSAVTVATDGGRSALATAAVLVIDVPESRMAVTTCDASKSPGLARLRSLKRLWSFGRQGPSGSTPPCAGGSGTADVERGISITCATPRAPV